MPASVMTIHPFTRMRQPCQSAARRGRTCTVQGMTTTTTRSNQPPLPSPLPVLWVVTRHAGAATWVQTRLGCPVRTVAHLHEHEIEPGARYHGVFPLNLAAAICRAGAECWAIAMELPPTLRGQELSAAQLDALGARLVRYEVREVPD
jgi:CRISPR-associated protein Csx16